MAQPRNRTAQHPLPFPPSGLLCSARWRPSRTPPAPVHYRAARLGTAARSSRARLLLLPLTAPWPHSSAHTRTRTRKSPTALLGLPTAPLAPRVRLPHALLFPSLTASWDPRQPPTRTSRPLSRCPAGPPVSRPRSLSFSSPTRSEPFHSSPVDGAAKHGKPPPPLRMQGKCPNHRAPFPFHPPCLHAYKAPSQTLSFSLFPAVLKQLTAVGEFPLPEH